MAQKKIESAAAEKPTNLSNEPVTFVDTLWDQYEQSLARSREMRDRREEAYIKTLKEVLKFNREYRKTLASLYKEARQTNNEIIKELANSINKKDAVDQAEEVKKENQERVELNKHLKQVSGQLEKLMLTPVKSTFDIIERLESNFEENAEASMKYSHDRRVAWQKVTDEYLKLARNSHHKIVDRIGESVKVLVGSK